MNTEFLPPQSIVGNGVVTGNQWQNPENIFLVDQQYAQSDATQGSASDFTIGNFNINLPVGSVVNGIEIEIIGLTGSPTTPPISLDLSFYDNSGGADAYYPYGTPITSLSPTESSITVGTPTFLFGTTFTVDQINNMKLNLTANGDISLDSVLAKVYYTGPATDTLNYNSLTGTFDVAETVTDNITGATATIVTDNGSDSMTVTNVTGFFQAGDHITGGTSGATALIDAITPGTCIDCSSPIQVQAMYLALPFNVGDTAFYLQPGAFAYPNGIPVQPGDIGSCGGTIPFVFDEGIAKSLNGQGFEENALLDTNNLGTWTVLSSGIIKVELGSVTQRGLDYKTPAVHVASNMSSHAANSKVIISNNEPYNLTLVRRCQEGTVFSAPITVQDEGVNVTTYAKLLNFVGNGVTATLAALHQVLITITDQFVKVSSVDTTPGYLADKLVAGTNVTLTPSGAGNETLTISASGGGTSDHKVLVSSVDTTANYLQSKIVAGTNVTITPSGAGNETLTISASGGGGGSGTVTSVSGSGGSTGLTLTGGPITTSGTLTLGGTLAKANGGTGNTSGIASTKVIVDTTVTAINSSTPITIYTAAIPAGTLSTSNAIRFKLFVTGLRLGSGGNPVNDTLIITASYGGTVFATCTICPNIAGTYSYDSAFVEGMLVATGATNSQLGTMTMLTGGGTSLQSNLSSSSSGTLAIDSTISENLVFTAALDSFSGFSPTATASALVVDLIS